MRLRDLGTTDGLIRTFGHELWAAVRTFHPINLLFALGVLFVLFALVLAKAPWLLVAVTGLLQWMGFDG